MRTHNGNVGAVIADISTVTYDTLKKYDIPYDEVYFVMGLECLIGLTIPE